MRQSRSLTKLTLTGVATFFSIIGLQTNAKADFIPELTGYAPTAGDPLSDSYINYGVYQNDGFTGNWRFDLGVDDQFRVLYGSDSGFAGNFVYFYQVVNTDHQDPGLELPLDHFDLTFPTSEIILRMLFSTTMNRVSVYSQLMVPKNMPLIMKKMPSLRA